ncbi:glycosyltransferase family 2 protein [Bifidobacterium breve]|uniref:glycosyltransferase family 2 protein n=1 Tax=Bifidobacterium breve TaxID=1685 RepID=UPI0030F3787A
MNPLVSVVIPVYNVEPYLHECVTSVVEQTYTNIEIILVDDGSTDSSGTLCDEFALSDSRICVFHKKNGGLSDARNYGIRRSHGSLISFIDSDDYVSPDYIMHLYQALVRGKTDIATTSICIFREGEPPKEHKRDTAEFHVYDACGALEDMLYMRHLEPNAFPKIYKKELFDTIQYPVGKLYEDIATTTKLIDKTGKIAYLDENDYYYRIRPNSIQTASFNPKKLDLLDQLNVVKSIVQTKYPSAINAYYSKEQSALFNLYMNISPDDTKEMLEISGGLWNGIKKNRISVLRDGEARPDARIASLLSFSGPSLCRCIYRLVRK